MGDIEGMFTDRTYLFILCIHYVYCIQLSDWHELSNVLPESTSLLQHPQLQILEPITIYHEFFLCLPVLRNSRLSCIRELVLIRITGLEERCESTSEALVDQWLGFLHGVDLIPLFVYLISNRALNV